MIIGLAPRELRRCTDLDFSQSQISLRHLGVCVAAQFLRVVALVVGIGKGLSAQVVQARILHPGLPATNREGILDRAVVHRLPSARGAE